MTINRKTSYLNSTRFYYFEISTKTFLIFLNIQVKGAPKSGGIHHNFNAPL